MSTLTRADIKARIQEAHDNDRPLDLSNQDLSGLDLSHLALRGANLQWADLRWANLRDADLRDTALRWTNLWGAYWDGLVIERLPSGQVYLVPTPDGWHMRVGCWDGTPSQLRTLIAQDDDWPEAEGNEIPRRRPYLEAALTLCEVHMADQADVIDQLRELWGEKAPDA
ncbi:pentapeptide repeat-containing protein [Corynebacterium sp. zg-331]|uniref:pentapeptide repeat-containing protein n=1 Tax=unclassified Corynebacterium TaxID=2624378 RepID=UPI00128BD7BB|nr:MULTISPECIES: pentapeptide repeat-containing protein [unclassified Corynebacterium]MBC3186383.1 pentapeptide repeat-containing protein [Corynebacterium sp. zg-331]MPV52870.1 pentapeptide repeat-containing protein [Corynebacterium sp. zg331]